MYLSRVAIDSLNRRKTRDLSHVGAYHSWVENSFPKELEENTRSRKLWRIDSIQGQRYLLVVSDEMPDLECLEKYGIPGSAQTKLYDKYLDSIEEGRLYRFRVTLNPVKALSQGAGKRGRVVPEITADQQLRYLESRAARLGFELPAGQYQIVERGWESYKKQGQKLIRLSKVTYEGILKVTDKVVFRSTLTEGIGKKKAYGFGLLTVVPM